MNRARFAPLALIVAATLASLAYQPGQPRAAEAPGYDCDTDSECVALYGEGDLVGYGCAGYSVAIYRESEDSFPADGCAAIARIDSAEARCLARAVAAEAAGQTAYARAWRGESESGQCRDNISAEGIISDD